MGTSFSFDAVPGLWTLGIKSWRLISLRCWRTTRLMMFLSSEPITAGLPSSVEAVTLVGFFPGEASNENFLETVTAPPDGRGNRRRLISPATQSPAP